MKTPKIVRRTSRHRTQDRARLLAGRGGESTVFATGLKLAVLILQVVGAVLQIWRR